MLSALKALARDRSQTWSAQGAESQNYRVESRGFADHKRLKPRSGVGFRRTFNQGVAGSSPARLIHKKELNPGGIPGFCFGCG